MTKNSMMNFGLFEDDQHYSSASSDSGVGGVENQKILEKTRKNEGFDLFLFERYDGFSRKYR